MNTKNTTIIPDNLPVPKFPDELNCDVVVIGGGPNGLICGAYLAKAGLKVILVEKRYEIGGGLATEEILFPGFYANTHATYHMMVDYIPAISDFNLQKHSLEFIKPNLQTGILFSDGTSLLLKSNLQDSVDEIAKFSLSDAEAFSKLGRLYYEMVDKILAPATYYKPISPVEFAVKLNRTEIGKKVLEISEKSPLEIIDENFKSEKLKALLLYITCMWGLDPKETGLGFMVPLLINRGLNKYLCLGGSHKFASALAKEIILQKGEILENSEVVKILTENSKAVGVEIHTGTKIKALVIASSLDPQTTFLKLIGEEKLPRDLLTYTKRWKWDKWSLFTLHLALDRAPEYNCDDKNINSTFINILGFENMDDVLKFFDSIKGGDIKNIAGHTTTETIFDNTLTRIKDKHIAFFQMPAPYDIIDGWEKRKKEIENKVLGLWRSFARNLSEENIIMKAGETPLDIERRIACMIKGSIKHGDYNPLQMGYFRPNDLCSSSKTPIDGLYLCGASVYPGGLIIGGPGYISANTIAEDIGIKKWWRYNKKIEKFVEEYIK